MLALDQQFTIDRPDCVEGAGDIGKGVGHVVAGAAVEPGLSGDMDDLHPDAVPFPFGGIVGQVDPQILQRMGKHEGAEDRYIGGRRLRARRSPPRRQGRNGLGGVVGASPPPPPQPPPTAPPQHVWKDAPHREHWATVDPRRVPISIYEVQAGSWDRDENVWYLSWDALAVRLLPYVVEMGFTHIEFLPISEHPYDPSCGYQPTGLYAPSARFGDVEGFSRFVDGAHRAGIGVILDWVPAHFPTDAHGLSHFDGTALYEHEDPRQGFHPDWNTAIYNFGRREVASFLVNNALFWPERYHIDGLRVDMVASMLSRGYSRKAGEWVPNGQGGRENWEAVEFLRQVNRQVYGQHPGVFPVAEGSAAWPGVSAPAHDGGLGFGFKWNMGFMHDTAGRQEPADRQRLLADPQDPGGDPRL